MFLGYVSATPSQEIIAKDIHGHEWSFKHTLRGDHSIFQFKICVFITDLYFVYKQSTRYTKNTSFHI